MQWARVPRSPDDDGYSVGRGAADTPGADAYSPTATGHGSSGLSVDDAGGLSASPTSSGGGLDEYTTQRINHNHMVPSDEYDDDADEQFPAHQLQHDAASSSNHFRLNSRWRSLPCCRWIVRGVPRAQVAALLSLAWPSALSLLGMQAVAMASLAFVGRLGEQELAGAAAGNAAQNVLGYAVVVGMNSAVDTLCAQSFGAGHKQLVGLVAQRAAAAFTLVLVPIFLAWWHTETLLLWTGQEEIVAELAGEYVRWSSPALLPFLYVDITRRFLQAQGITRPQIWISLAANVVHALLTWLCVFQLQLGLRGAAMAYAATHWTTLVLYLCYIRWGDRQRMYRSMCPTLVGVGSWKQVFSGWGALYSLGLPGTFMLLGEWSVFELISLASGWLGRRQLDTFVLLQNVAVAAFMMPLSLSIAASILVGNALGACQPRQARLVARGAMMLAMAFLFVEVLILSFLRGRTLGAIFTNEEPVLDLFEQVQWYLFWLLPFDCLQCVQGGVIRGAGFQKLGAVINLVSYWLLGIPLALGLAFGTPPHLGLPGLLVGMATAVTVTAGAYALQLRRVDWNVESQKALQRVEEERRAGLDSAVGNAGVITDPHFGGSIMDAGAGTHFDANAIGGIITEEADEEDGVEVRAHFAPTASSPSSIELHSPISPASAAAVANNARLFAVLRDKEDAAASSSSAQRGQHTVVRLTVHPPSPSLRGHSSVAVAAGAGSAEEDDDDALDFALDRSSHGDSILDGRKADLVLSSASPPMTTITSAAPMTVPSGSALVPPPVRVPTRSSFASALARTQGPH